MKLASNFIANGLLFHLNAAVERPMALRKFAVYEPVSIAFLGYSDDGEKVTHGRDGKELI
jgi:hypothetical protein